MYIKLEYIVQFLIHLFTFLSLLTFALNYFKIIFPLWYYVSRLFVNCFLLWYILCNKSGITN